MRLQALARTVVEQKHPTPRRQTRSNIQVAVGGLIMRMRKDQIPDFVRDVLLIGCDIAAIGDTHYVIDDANVIRAADRRRLYRIWADYGDRDHLKFEIIAYLNSIGRSFDGADVPDGRSGLGHRRRTRPSRRRGSMRQLVN